MFQKYTTRLFDQRTTSAFYLKSSIFLSTLKNHTSCHQPIATERSGDWWFLTKNKKLFIIFSSAFLVVFIDQLTKLIIKNTLALNQNMPIIKNIFHLTYITNTGSVFGILKGWQLPIIFFSIVVIGFIFYYLDKIEEKEKLLQIFVGFILGATIGNLIDRLIFGHVIDFFDFRVWPVFNVADSFITVSVIFLIIYFWKK